MFWNPQTTQNYCGKNEIHFINWKLKKKLLYKELLVTLELYSPFWFCYKSKVKCDEDMEIWNEVILKFVCINRYVSTSNCCKIIKMHCLICIIVSSIITQFLKGIISLKAIHNNKINKKFKLWNFVLFDILNPMQLIWKKTESIEI